MLILLHTEPSVRFVMLSAVFTFYGDVITLKARPRPLHFLDQVTLKTKGSDPKILLELRRLHSQKLDCNPDLMLNFSCLSNKVRLHPIL